MMRKMKIKTHLSLCLLGDELEYLRPNVYRNVARQLNITIASESIVSDAFLAVAAEIFSTGWSMLCLKINLVQKTLWVNSSVHLVSEMLSTVP